MLAREESEEDSFEYERKVSIPERFNDKHKETAPSPIERPVVLNKTLRRRCFLLVAVVAVLTGVVVVQNGIMSSRGYDLVRVQQQAAALEQENEHLKVDVAQLRAPQRIKAIAEQKLGMVVPKYVYFAGEKH